MRRGEAGSTLIERPNNDPVPDFHECKEFSIESGLESRLTSSLQAEEECQGQ